MITFSTAAFIARLEDMHYVIVQMIFVETSLGFSRRRLFSVATE